MKCIKLFSIVVVMCGFTLAGYAQTPQEVVEAINKGRELMAAGNLDGAIVELEKSVEMAKKVGEEAEEYQVIAETALPGLYLRKADNILKTGDLPATLKALEATVAAAEKYKNPAEKEKAEKIIPVVYQRMGNADYTDKKFEAAIKNFEQALARDPNLVAIYFTIGACYQQLKDEAKMEENYKLAIEKGDAKTAQNAKTQLTRYYNNAGATAQKAKKWDEAIAAFSKTVEVDDKNTDAYYALAMCYIEKKSWDNTISNAEKALELGDTRTDMIYYYLGSAFAGKNDNAKACENFKKVTGGSALAGAKYQIEHVLKCK